jgi:fructose-1,6-bisphosphatase/inositol monophosphatase family enzyme
MIKKAMANKNMHQSIPDDTPIVILPAELEGLDISDVIAATTTAGVWAEKRLNEFFTSVRGRTASSIEVKKEGADIKSYIDDTSEKIMQHILCDRDHQGGIFSEEGIIANPMHEISILLDGLDGTENALRQVEGPKGSYGVLAGTFRSENGRIKPLTGAGYNPAEKAGFAGSTKDHCALEYRVEKEGDLWVIADVRELERFNQTRTDPVVQVAVFPSKAGDPLPDWFNNLYMNLSINGEQNCMYGTSTNRPICNLLETYPGGRRIGPSVYVAAQGIKLHDIMWAAPIIQVLGGVIGNAKGARLEDEQFIPKTYTDQGKKQITGGLEGLKEKGIICKVPIGPIICSQNEALYEKIRGYLNTVPKV